MTPQIVAFAFNTAPLADADVFGTNVQPCSPATTLIGYKDTLTLACDSTAPVVSIEMDITRGEVSATDKTFTLNAGAAIATASLYTFDLPVFDGLSYNISLSLAATCTAWIMRSFNADL